jgi:hypothetical protein
MKNISIKTIIFAFLALFALVLSACDDILLDRANSGGEGPAGGISGDFGTITISLSQGAGQKPIDDLVLDNLYLEYKFSRSGGTFEEKTPDEGKFVLEPGDYTLTVNAYTDSGKGTLVAEGQAEFTISASVEADPVNLTLYPPAEGGGSGSLDFKLKYPYGGTVETLTLTPIAVDGNKPDLETNGTSSTNEGTVTFAVTESGLAAGYYLLRVVLKNAEGAVTGRVKVVHIYRGITTNADYTFSAEDFRAYLVTSAADTGEGTLRDAITNAGAGQTIRVTLEPGSVITLKSSLTITKSLSIEGNSVTLTCDESWGTAGNLLYINNSDTTVNISRVHFKDGLQKKENGQGAAISNAGILTLESCIFSGNRNTVGRAGAITSGGPLTIRGCTFYGNSVSGVIGGAAIFFETSSDGTRSLTLTGNLFYGNTAPNYPVVRAQNNNTITTTCITASYNLTDAPLGSGVTDSGFTGSSNTYSPYIPVSPRNFYILNGSAAATTARLPATLPTDYPTTDFYGQPISVNGAVGAVQTVTASGKYFLGYSANDSGMGTLALTSGSIDTDGMVSAGSSITLTASPASGGGNTLAYWLRDGNKVAETGNTYTFNIDAHTLIQAVFVRLVTVSSFTDENVAGTLRHALANAQDDDVIRVNVVKAGETTIAWGSKPPIITKSITIEGNGVVLTRAASWTDTGGADNLLFIESASVVVNIRRVHFKNGLTSGYGAAIRNAGTLTLESCIFSGNQTTVASTSARGGAVYSSGNLTIRGCTFYGNSTGSTSATYGGGAVHFSGNGKSLTLTGNLFSKGGGVNPFVKAASGTTVTASYNVVDVAFGTGSAQAGWAKGATDQSDTAGTLVFPNTFKIPSGSTAAGMLSSLPEGYPTTDFYGKTIGSGGQAGAVQTVTASGKYFLGYSANNGQFGSVSVTSGSLDDDSMAAVNSSITLKANPEKAGAGMQYDFQYWLYDGQKVTTNPYTITMTGDTVIQAVFSLARVVNVFDPAPNVDSATSPGTLRYALTKADAGDVIRFTGVTPGTTTVTLASVLPQITKNLTIEGNGVTLTRAANWTASETSQLLFINSETVVVSISRVHFKNGLASFRGGAIRNIGDLTLESCVFSGNRNSSANAYAGGGAIHSMKPFTGSNMLTIRGCTFYENSATTNGGAVSVSGGMISPYTHLILTGNLFYGSKGNYPVVYDSGGISNNQWSVTASYNVVDVDLGITGADSGWTAGTGDKTFTDLSIIDPPIDTTTFVPVSGLKTFLQSAPEGFPTTYFNGATRTFPGAPGAVEAAQ